MRVYFGAAGREAAAKLSALKGQYALESFAYPLHHKWRTHFRGVYLDSGAYTAWKKGGKVDEEKYIDYALSGDFDAVASDLNVTAPPDETLRVAERLHDFNLPAVPGFHQGEPFEVLDYMVRKFKMIGIGCTEQATHSASVRRWLEDVFARICNASGRPLVRVHGYRLVSYANDFPFYSVDSTSWTQGNSKASWETIQKAMPWLTPEEVGACVLRFYERMPRCSRLEKIEGMQPCLKLA